METEMLDPSERRRLQEIEHALRNDDPEFAERIGTTSGTPRRSGVSRQLYAVLVIGVVVALCGFLAPVFFAVGLSFALSAMTVLLATSWLDRREPRPDEGDGDLGPDPRDDDPGEGELRV